MLLTTPGRWVIGACRDTISISISVYNININISLQYQRQSTLLFSSNHQGPSSKQRTADAITSELDITHNFRSIIDKEYVDISAFAIKVDITEKVINFICHSN